MRFRSFTDSASTDHSTSTSTKSRVSAAQTPIQETQENVLPDPDQVLTEAAEEAQRIQTAIAAATSNRRYHLPATSVITEERRKNLIHEETDLIQASESLLVATKASVLLAKAIAKDPQEDRAQLLHRSFLGMLQRCLSILPLLAAMRNVEGGTDRSEEFSTQPLFESDPLLLDHILLLTVRARDVGLPFHLPLYESIASGIAQYSHSSQLILEGSLQIGNWVQKDLDASLNITHEVFFPSLIALANRHRLVDLVDLLKALRTEFQLTHLPETVVQRILVAFKETIQQTWGLAKVKQTEPYTSKPAALSPMEQIALEDLLVWLEPSIWKIFGYTPTPEGSVDHANSLRDALEVLMTLDEDLEAMQTNSNLQQTQLDEMLQAILNESPELIQSIFPEELNGDFPFEPFLEDDDDEEELDGSSKQQFQKGKWQFHVETNEDMTVVGVTRLLQDDEEDDDFDHEQSDITTGRYYTKAELDSIYCRDALPRPLPDLVEQLQAKMPPEDPVAPKTGPLKYKPSFAKAMYEQLRGTGSVHRI